MDFTCEQGCGRATPEGCRQPDCPYATGPTPEHRNVFSPRERAFRRFAVIFGLAVVIFTLIHQAADAAPFTPELRYAYALAEQHWGGPPTGCTSIDFEIVPNGSLGDAEGMATLPELGGEAPQPCFLDIIARDAAPSWFERACAVMRHEDGHLHGLQHSDDPRNIMYPSIVFIPRECWNAGLFVMNHPRRFR